MIKKETIINSIIITIIFIISIVIINILSLSFSILKYKKADYYILGNDKIPSIYKVVKQKNLYYYKTKKENNIITKTYKFKNVKNVKSDISNYIKELKDNYGYVYTSKIDLNKNTNKLEISANSNDINNIIIVNISYNKNSYIINISKGKGKINLY